MLNIQYQTIKKISILYCALPVLCFTLFYMQSWPGYLASAVLVFLVYWVLRRKCTQETAELQLSWKILLILFGIVFLWAAFGGMGNHYYQSDDWNCRNAIFRDLIYQGWPVIYAQYNKALVYYIGYWLPSASVVKIISKICPGILSSDAAFVLGNQLLWIWTAIGLFIVELLLITYIRPSSRKKIFAIPALLIGFSGLDILGALYKIIAEGREFTTLHLEWWMDNIMQFSSLTTCLFWVFNQCVIPWIVILCVLQEDTVRDYMLLGVCTLISGPLPFLGIFVYMVAYAIVLLVRAIKANAMREYLKNLLSLQNWLALVFIPILFLYYKSNGAVTSGADDSSISIFGIVNLVPVTGKYLLQVFFFLLCEVGIYFILLFKRYKMEPFFYITIGTACIAPFCSVGTLHDFIMRFSIPTIMVLAALCGKYVCEPQKRPRHIRYVLLCVALMIGAVTPMTEFMRGYVVTLETGQINNVDDELKTFNQDLLETGDLNFMTYDYMEQPFFKYLVNTK